jgi:hypothetical protein
VFSQEFYLQWGTLIERAARGHARVNDKQAAPLLSPFPFQLGALHTRQVSNIEQKAPGMLVQSPTVTSAHGQPLELHVAGRLRTQRPDPPQFERMPRKQTSFVAQSLFFVHAGAPPPALWPAEPPIPAEPPAPPEPAPPSAQNAGQVCPLNLLMH